MPGLYHLRFWSTKNHLRYNLTVVVRPSEAVKQLHRILPGYQGLKTEVGCHSRPIQQIGLEHYVLRNGRPRQPSN